MLFMLLAMPFMLLVMPFVLLAMPCMLLEMPFMLLAMPFMLPAMLASQHLTQNFLIFGPHLLCKQVFVVFARC